MSLEKVRRGQRLRIRASDWNAVMEAASAAQARRQDRSAESAAAGLGPGQVWVRNDSGAARDRFGVLAATGPIFEPSDSPGVAAFVRQVAVDGDVPGGPDDPFVVLAEPLADGAIGRAWAGGVCPVQVNVTDADHQFAVPADGDAAKLVSAAAGGAPIIYKPAGTGTLWALVRLERAGLPAGTAADQLLYWDEDGKTWLLLDPPSSGYKLLAWSPANRLHWIDNCCAGQPCEYCDGQTPALFEAVFSDLTLCDGDEPWPGNGQSIVLAQTETPCWWYGEFVDGERTWGVWFLIGGEAAEVRIQDDEGFPFWSGVTDALDCQGGQKNNHWGSAGLCGQFDEGKLQTGYGGTVSVSRV